MLNKEEIKKIIPQREPFLMIDEVETFEPGQSAVAFKYVNEEEWYFKGHFPGNPIMPGVLIAESLAQTGAVAILSIDFEKLVILMKTKVKGLALNLFYLIGNSFGISLLNKTLRGMHDFHQKDFE